MVLKRLLISGAIVAVIALPSGMHAQSTAPDVAVVVYQQNINKLLGMMGPISGKTTYNIAISSGELNWEVRNPRIEIGSGSAKFVADTTVKAGFFNSNPQAFGKVDVQYDAKRHKIRVKLTQVGFDAYLDLFGSRNKVASVDLSPYFKQLYEFDAPTVESATIKVPVSDTASKTIRVTPGVPVLALEPGKIVLNVSLDYNEVE